MGIVEVKKTIRKAVESPLFTLAQAQTPKLAVEWTGIPLDRTNTLPKEYVNCAISYGVTKILEIGPTPRFQASGALSLVVCTAVGQGPDRNDTLAGIIAGAYPYGELLVRDGVTLIVDKIDTGAYAIDGAWLVSAVIVNWDCYRRS